jgi:hypothetical protein
MDRTPEQRTTYIVIAFALIFVVILCTASFVIVRPFLAPLLWGVILAIATWPIYLVQATPGRRQHARGGTRAVSMILESAIGQEGFQYLVGYARLVAR